MEVSRIPINFHASAEKILRREDLATTTGETVTREAPTSAINTTPLIDVMLVLLIMFVMTIPVATNTIQIDLPTGVTDHPAQLLLNTLSLDADGTIRWNGDHVGPTAIA